MMKSDEKIEMLFFESNIGKKFKKISEELSKMKCDQHETNADNPTSKMYLSYRDGNKIIVKTTDFCCCKKFSKQLIEKANMILNEND